ncbi:hypothetical protein HU830_03900 [Lactobacillus sp. DCY120]|uniref:Uncharacterized protein n=1 Tax=Bombilactobacillus apium TaxID=2675299 RepID=A0A850R703_9LACO|nr:hypothetical protein [Bombilactobacillus apium]NVY96315.1 hypothetical protein [Bombilactobacillus apium]
MKNTMIAVLAICLVCTVVGMLLGNWWLGIVPLFIAFWPTAYFASQE